MLPTHRSRRSSCYYRVEAEDWAGRKAEASICFCPTCGDNVCETNRGEVRPAGNDDGSCCRDCASCGDGHCASAAACGPRRERTTDCCTDCGTDPNDGVCNCGETPASACRDCGWCGDGVPCPDDGENRHNCCEDMGHACPDGICAGACGEDCNCGDCPPCE